MSDFSLHQLLAWWNIHSQVFLKYLTEWPQRIPNAVRNPEVESSHRLLYSGGWEKRKSRGVNADRHTRELCGF